MRSEVMVAREDNSRVHVRGEEKGGAMLEATRTIVQIIQKNVAEHHGPARVGVRHPLVAPGVLVPRLFIVANFTRAGDLEECVRRALTGVQVSLGI